MPLFLEPPAAGEFDPYYEKYIARVGKGDFIEILAHQADETLSLLRAKGFRQEGRIPDFFRDEVALLFLRRDM